MPCITIRQRYCTCLQPGAALLRVLLHHAGDVRIPDDLAKRLAVEGQYLMLFVTVGLFVGQHRQFGMKQNFPQRRLGQTLGLDGI